MMLVFTLDFSRVKVAQYGNGPVPFILIQDINVFPKNN